MAFGEVIAEGWSKERKLALAIMLMALAIALSPVHIPIGPTKAFPGQHIVNAIAGVILGPLWASAMALGIGIIRMSLGLGTIYSIPGGIPGAFVVGLAALVLKKAGRDPIKAALLEPLGTAVIGFLLALYLFAPLVGDFEKWRTALIPIWATWIASTGVGTAIGYTALRVLRRTGLIQAPHSR